MDYNMFQDKVYLVELVVNYLVVKSLLIAVKCYLKVAKIKLKSKRRTLEIL